MNSRTGNLDDRCHRDGKRIEPLPQRIARAQALADAMGPNDPDFDMKAFTDERWGDLECVAASEGLARTDRG